MDYKDWKVKSFTVRPVDPAVAMPFIRENHYTRNTNGLNWEYCFGLYAGDTLIGAMIYGMLSMRNAWKPYGDSPNDVIELKRLACIDATPKNTETYFIGHTLRWLARNTQYKRVVSYADPHFGHSGVIYRASNFKYCGQTDKGRSVQVGNRLYHGKSLRTTYKGKLKAFAVRLLEQLANGEAQMVITEGKHIYTYDLC